MKIFELFNIFSNNFNILISIFFFFFLFEIFSNKEYAIKVFKLDKGGDYSSSAFSQSACREITVHIIFLISKLYFIIIILNRYI